MKKLVFIVLSISFCLIACGSGGDDILTDDDPVTVDPVLNEGGVEEFTKVQPMTGIVVWDSNSSANAEAHSLEYSYMLYEDIVSEKGVYDWTVVEDKFNSIASKKHQTI